MLTTFVAAETQMLKIMKAMENGNWEKIVEGKPLRRYSRPKYS